VCYYPDKTRNKLKECYFEQNETEKEIIEEIKILIKNFNYKNKRKLVDLIKLEYRQNIIQLTRLLKKIIFYSGNLRKQQKIGLLGLIGLIVIRNPFFYLILF